MISIHLTIKNRLVTHNKGTLIIITNNFVYSDSFTEKSEILQLLIYSYDPETFENFINSRAIKT